MSLAIVTGASSGIGREVSRLLAEARYDIVIVGRRESELQKLAGELSHLKVNITLKCVDLNNLNSLDQIFSNVSKLDVLINCAGLAKFGTVDLNSLADDQNTINVNCLALVQLCRLAQPLMQHGGTIVNVSSLASEIPLPHMAVYSGSKAFVTNFTLAFAEEVRDQNINVVCVSPGGVNTPFIVQAGMDESVNKNSSAMLVSPNYVAKSIVRSIRYPKSNIVPARSGLLIPLLLWLLPRKLLAKLAGSQYKSFYRKNKN